MWLSISKYILLYLSDEFETNDLRLLLIKLLKFSSSNEDTFSSIINFIKNNQDYYTNSLNVNPEDSSDNFTIITNGKEYDLYWKYKYEFLAKMAIALKLNNCDKKAINKISNYK